MHEVLTKIVAVGSEYTEIDGLKEAKAKFPGRTIEAILAYWRVARLAVRA